MSPIDRMQVEDLLHELTQLDDQFNALVAQLHFMLDSIEFLAEREGELPERSQFGLHLSAGQLKDHARDLGHANCYLHGMLRDVLLSSDDVSVALQEFD